MPGPSRPLPELAAVEHRFVEVPGVGRMHLADTGEGEAVVLVHGWPQHWWEWRHLIPWLAERRRVLCPDLRGFGWSDAPERGYEKEQLAADLIAALDALGVDRFDLVGHDWGGVVGFILCVRYPQRVRRYLALNTGHLWPRFSVRRSADLWRFWYQAVIGAPLLGQAAVRRARRLDWARMSRGSWTEADQETFLAQFREPERARASVLLYRSFLVGELPAMVAGRYRRSRLTTRTLFLHGARDPVIRPWMLEGYEAHADEMTIDLVEDCGHFIADERPELVAERATALFAAPTV